jgi:hypothetical protein
LGRRGRAAELERARSGWLTAAIAGRGQLGCSHRGGPACCRWSPARLTIRPLQETDFDALHAVDSDPDVVPYIPGGVRDKEGTRRRLDELMAHHEQHGELASGP